MHRSCSMEFLNNNSCKTNPFLKDPGGYLPGFFFEKQDISDHTTHQGLLEFKLSNHLYSFTNCIIASEKN